MKMIARMLIIVLCVSGWNSVSSQTYSILISDKVIHDFFIKLSKDLPKEIIQLNKEIMDWNEKDLYGEQDTLYQMGELTKGIMEIDSVKLFFTQKDLKYVEKQYNNLEDDYWYPEDFRRFEIIDTNGMNRILNHSYSGKKMGKNYAYRFSIPLFSLNQKYAIVQQEYYCGFECSTYCIYMYKRSTDKKSWSEVAKWKCISVLHRKRRD